VESCVADMDDQREVILVDSQDTASSEVPVRKPLHRKILGLCGPVSMDAPFSTTNEIRFFFNKGVPLCIGSVMNFGLPPLVAMALAGHTHNSAHLQASLGYARVWYNITLQMTMVSLTAYFNNVIPGCIGAGRQDRIPRYLQRSVALIFVIMCPFYALQFASGSILYACGVPLSNADEVERYCRLMIITAILNIFNQHLQVVLNNLGYVKSTMLNSLVMGFFLDSSCNYLFVLKWGWGMEGAALARIVVQLCRLILFLVTVGWFGLYRAMCVVSDMAEPLLNKTEFREFVKMGQPQLLANWCSWLVFELQLMAMANISGITTEALAAGAIWVNFETAMAASQEGWMTSTVMRVMALLGKSDPGARPAFWLLHNLSAFTVVLFNVVFLLLQPPLCRLVSNDALTQYYLEKILWILVFHTQTRISCVTMFLYIPTGKGNYRIYLSFVAFYCIAVPIVAVVALSDLVTTSVVAKLAVCVGGTSIAQFVLAVVFSFWLHRLDWDEASAMISGRANTDQVANPLAGSIILGEVGDALDGDQAPEPSLCISPQAGPEELPSVLDNEVL